MAWKLNGNFHPGLGGVEIRKWSNLNGTPPIQEDTNHTDTIIYCDRVQLVDGRIILNLKDREFHCYYEE